VNLPELELDQRRQLIDVQQRFEAWRAADRAFRASNKGSMAWKRIKGREYLYRIVNRHTQKYIGPRSPETELLKNDYIASRTSNRARITKMRKGIEKAAPINRAMGLGRLPRAAATILRALDRAGLLGDGLFIVGTHALYAYEVKSGIIFEPELLATRDLDLLADVRSRLVLAIDDKEREGILPILKSVDESFAVQGELFRAVNADGYFVDVIRQMRRNEVSANEYDLDGIVPVGMPVWMSCIDPRAFALHKYWVSKQPSREAIKKHRDALQAAAVALVVERLGLKFNQKELSALPKELVSQWKNMIKIGVEIDRT
jgi:hypothetical protein